MSYAFNEDRSKVEVYTKSDTDAISNFTNSRINTLVDHGTGGIEVRELLWESESVDGAQGTLFLDGNPYDYDCLDVIVSHTSDELTQKQRKIVRIPVEEGSLIDAIVTDSSGDMKVLRNTIGIELIDNRYAFRTYPGHSLTYDSGTWTYNLSTYGAIWIYAIYGIKYSQDCSTEVSDIRVGYDGTIYPTAGDAVRDQILSIVNSLVTRIETLEQEVFPEEEI